MAFPHVFQHDFMDCGPTCLSIIATFYGHKIPVERLRKLCYTTREGTSLLGIGDAAEKLGFHTIGVKLSWERLQEEATLPCIIHWNQNHFIVVYKIKRKNSQCYVYVSDPAAGLLKYTKEQFLKSWLEIHSANGKSDMGIVLLLEPMPAFYEQCQSDTKQASSVWDIL